MHKKIATVYRTDNGASLKIGIFGRFTKMAMFRVFINNGESICTLFDDYGEFTFEWNKRKKVWEFFSQHGEKVGFAKFENI